jgi:hypothetical protein
MGNYTVLYVTNPRNAHGSAMDSLKKEHLGDGWEKERDMDGILIGEVQRW